MKRKENRRSMSLVVLSTITQVILFVFIMLMILAALFLFQREVIQEFRDERENALYSELRLVQSRLDEDRRQVLELVQLAMNRRNLLLDDSEKVVAKIAFHNELMNKASLFDDAGGLFVYQEEGFFVSGSYDLLNATSAQYEWQNWLTDYLQNSWAPEQQGVWQIHTVGEEGFLLLLYRYNTVDTFVGLSIPLNDVFADIEAILPNGLLITDSLGGVYGSLDEGDSSTVLVQGETPSDGLVVQSRAYLDLLEATQQGAFGLLVLLALLCVLGITVQHLVYRKWVVRPITQLSEALSRATVNPDNLGQLRIPTDAPLAELSTLQNTFNHLMEEVISGRMQLYEKKIEEQELLLRQLRAQLRSHFYLNAITTVNSMTYQNRNEEIRRYLSLLSQYMRYIMRSDAAKSSLKEELDHIQTYISMQEIKFPNSVVSFVECPPSLENQEIPTLILFTVVENTFKYAMNLEDTLTLFITCDAYEEQGFSGFRVVVEDNGPGFPQEVLEAYQGENIPDKTGGHHIGLSNVKRSLALWYGRQDLLRLENAVPSGAQVEILIPWEKSEGGNGPLPETAGKEE